MLPVLNVAYVTTLDPQDVRNWSGIARSVAKAVDGDGVRLASVGRLEFREPLAVKLLRRFHRYALQKWYDPERDPRVARHFAAQVDDFVREHRSDCVLSLGTIPIGFCNSAQPVAIWSDATLPALLNFYPGYANVSKATIQAARRIEQRAFERCSRAIFASEWAANSAITNYGLNRAKIDIVPFGANFDAPANDTEIQTFIEGRRAQPCRLLFLGVEWDRKGGPLAWKVAARLNQTGFATELHVVGCDPPSSLATVPWLFCHGFLRKDSPEEANKLSELLGAAHFLILPARAECFGIVFAEASAFGVPSIATSVGGIPSAVRSGRNGRLFSIDADVEEYVSYIRSMLSDWSAYVALARNARTEFQQRLNWKVIGAKIRSLLRDMVSNRLD